MSVYFEKRVYTRDEMGAILRVDPKDPKFATKVKTRLGNLGFSEEDYIYTRKDVTILWVPTKVDEKITYLVRLLGIDTRVNVHNFSMFLYGLIISEDLQAMPWPEKSAWMKDNWDIEVDERCLRRWTSKLIDLGALTKEKREGKWWCSSKIGGETVRDLVESEEDIAYMRQYWEEWRSLKETLPYKNVFTKLWDKYQCTFYKCPEFLACAWNEPIIEELYSVMVQYVEEYWTAEMEV